MLIMLASFFFEKVAKTGETLIMLIMLIIWGLTGDPPPKKKGVSVSPQMINMINMINISRVLATFSKKN